MSETTDAAFYEQSGTVDRYVADRADGLTDREARAVHRYFAGGRRVLDVGCGAGRTTQALAARGFEVVGLDVSTAMVRAAADADPDIQYVAGDAARLPVADERVDHVLFSYNGIDELRPALERVRALREAYRVLEPGGRFAFSTHNYLRWLVPYPPTRDHLRSMWRFWADNARRGNLRSPYKSPPGGRHVRRIYFTDPVSVVRRVEAVGFDVLALLGRSGRASKYLGPALFVVAEKPAR